MRRAFLGGIGAVALTALGAAAPASADAAAGEATYKTFCFSCHGLTGKGDGPAGAVLNPKPRDFTVGDFKLDADGDGTPGTDADLALVIRNGAQRYGGSPLMAPWGHMTDQQIADLVAYVRSLRP